MALVTVVLHEPTPPPVKEVNISLNLEEAAGLAHLLGGGVTLTTLESLGLGGLLDALSRQASVQRNRPRTIFQHFAKL